MTGNWWHPNMEVNYVRQSSDNIPVKAESAYDNTTANSKEKGRT
jgi:hypothetical protein